MDIARLKRYKDKIEFIALRKEEFEEWSEGILQNDKDKLSSYKAFQEMAEAINDLIAMMLKDSDLLPGDDYTNIEKSVKQKLLPAELKVPLEEMTGLRNRLVHEYNELDDALAKESALELLPFIDKYCDLVEQWLRRQ